jgi:aminopeptidase
MIMVDPRLKNLAQILVNYSVGVQPGDDVAIRCDGSIAAALPLMQLIYREVLEVGAHPQPIIFAGRTEEFDHILYSMASDDQLARKDPMYDLIVRNCQCDIRIRSSVNTRRLSNVDPSRWPMHWEAQSELVQRFIERASKGDLRWVVTACPTTGYAQDAEMSVSEFEDFLFSTTFADRTDPATAWSKLSTRQARLIEWLRGKSTVRVIGDHVDMKFSILDRSFINCDGHLCMPDGEIFTGPVESSVNGWFKSTFPAIFFGVDCGMVSIKFKDGVIIEADAEKNHAYFSKHLEMDEGARRLGEFGIGTNNQINTFTKDMLFDEKIGGTVHFALGGGYPETGSQNHSSLHWDLLVDMREGGQIIVDDEVFYDSGKFKI